uniref:E-selectin-like n=1 Tax=Crassostrea virginica TaxID=6565 RepID=A0A8B8CCN7_CRAVI|nr:E-selectin-like [Crassostrea virginica]
MNKLLSTDYYLLTEIRCRKVPELQGVGVTPDKISYDFNETISFHCSDYRRRVYGPTSARCSEQGWEYDGPSLPVCENRFCDATWIFRNRMYTTPRISGMVSIGTRFRPHCYENDNLRCGQTIQCLPGGFLNTGMMCHCEDRHCYRKSNDTLDKPHLILTPSKGSYRYEETVSLSCEQGYILRGSSSARCSDRERFDFNHNAEPECVRKSID